MSLVKTTIKTDICSFTEYRIYPGRGMKFVARDGKVHTLINPKVISLFHQKKKPARLRWTLSWRRANKKTKVETTTKRRSRKTAKQQKAIVGLTLEDIKRKRAQKPELRQAARDAAVKEAKERQAKKAAASSKSAVPRSGAAPTNMKPVQMKQAVKQKVAPGGKRK